MFFILISKYDQSDIKGKILHDLHDLHDLQDLQDPTPWDGT
jgi:hypothetical protein